jgi:hypothetical protein
LSKSRNLYQQNQALVSRLVHLKDQLIDLKNNLKK